MRNPPATASTKSPVMFVRMIVPPGAAACVACWSDVLKDNGYSLGYLGKWHLWPDAHPDMERWGYSGWTHATNCILTGNAHGAMGAGMTISKSTVVDNNIGVHLLYGAGVTVIDMSPYTSAW